MLLSTAMLNKLCAWQHNMPPPPASLTIISCKYENRKRQQFTTEFAKRQTTRKNKHCAILPSVCRHCQSKANHSRIWAQAMSFCPSNNLIFDLLTLKVVSKSRVTWATSIMPNFSFPRPLYSRLRPDVRDRQTDRRQTDRRQMRIIV